MLVGFPTIAEVLYQMDKQVKLELANALEIEPDEIMDFKQKEDGTYNVILFSFQKHTGVVPSKDSHVPVEFRKAYSNPHFARKDDLKGLAQALDLEVDGDLRKDYIEAIQAYQER
jgi:hypothetical protein